MIEEKIFVALKTRYVNDKIQMQIEDLRIQKFKNSKQKLNLKIRFHDLQVQTLKNSVLKIPRFYDTNA